MTTPVGKDFFVLAVIYAIKIKTITWSVVTFIVLLDFWHKYAQNEKMWEQIVLK